MFNLKFDSIEQCKKVNNLTEAQIVHHLKSYFDNQNYRSEYNKRKNELNKLLKDDPIVKERLAAVRKAIAGSK